MDVLSEEQQVRLNEKKVRPPPLPPHPLASHCALTHAFAAPQVELRLDNERYLRKHPELRQLFKHFMAQVLEEKPANVQEFAAHFFTQADLRDQVM